MVGYTLGFVQSFQSGYIAGLLIGVAFLGVIPYLRRRRDLLPRWWLGGYVCQGNAHRVGLGCGVCGGGNLDCFV